MKTVTTALHLSDRDRLVKMAEEQLFQTVKSHQPATYHFEAGGQRMRMKTCLEACIALAVEEQDSIALACCIELLHNASLIHDDLQDKDTVRRGSPTLWSKYGAAIAVCSGDLLLTKAFGILSTMSTTDRLADILNEVQYAVSETIQGQCEDLSQTATTTAAEYEDIAAKKSGPFIALPLVLPLMVGGFYQSVSRARQAVRCFAIAYQIADDIGDWQADARLGHLNLVNIYRMNDSDDSALSMANERALYLLRRCQRELDTLPAKCAVGVTKAARTIQAKLEG